MKYYEVTIDGLAKIVRSTDTAQVKRDILEHLRQRYSYKRATTEAVVQAIQSGQQIEDLAKTFEK